MSGGRREGTARVLGGEGFDRLLAVLDPDRDEAGRRYDLFRRKLVRFFEWKGAPWPDELADETLDRFLLRLRELPQEVAGPRRSLSAHAAPPFLLAWRPVVFVSPPTHPRTQTSRTARRRHMRMRSAFSPMPRVSAISRRPSMRVLLSSL